MRGVTEGEEREVSLATPAPGRQRAKGRTRGRIASAHLKFPELLEHQRGHSGERDQFRKHCATAQGPVEPLHETSTSPRTVKHRRLLSSWRPLVWHGLRTANYEGRSHSHSATMFKPSTSYGARPPTRSLGPSIA